VKAPGFGDRRKAMLEDIATLTGGKAITEDLGLKLENLKIEDLGKAKKITIDKDNTTIIEGAGKKDAIKKRAADLDAACTICRAAHVNAEAAKAANLRSLQARQDQEKLLELMRPPALCLCFLAVLTGISASGGALHSQLVSIIHKLGATKKLADTAVRALEKVVRFLPDAFNLHPEEVHPNRCVNPAPPFGLDRSDIAKFMWEWKGVLPYMDIAERAYAAYPHVETLAGLTASFGSAYGAESTSNGQLDAAQALLAEHWHRRC
jgi:hypothetical protein